MVIDASHQERKESSKKEGSGDGIRRRQRNVERSDADIREDACLRKQQGIIRNHGSP
jgi:hypothetical protein